MKMKLKYPKWTVFLLICLGLFAYSWISDALRSQKIQKENAERHAYEKNCGNPPHIDIVAKKKYYLDQERLKRFYDVLDYVVPPPRPSKSGRMSYFVPSFRAMYLSPFSAKDYQEFITLIESMDIHKTLKDNFKLEAGVINDGGEVRYFIANKDVTREEYIEFFKKNLRKFSILEDGKAISSLRFIPLQDGLITFEEKADAEADPYSPFKYLAHYLNFPFSRYCCDINELLEQQKYMKERNPKEDLYTLKDIPDIAAARKQDPNLILKTSDIQLIGRIGLLDTVNNVMGSKSTPVPSSGEYGHSYSSPINTCNTY